VKKLKALLVDDEASARDVLENLLLRFCPEIELLAKCEGLESAVEQINQHQPDLVFLDIEMPNYAGYEIVKFFDSINFEIIFVTAYDRYAIKAFEIAAIDYLLKPIDIERLKASVARIVKQKEVAKQLERISVLSSTIDSKQIKNIVVFDKGQQHVVSIDTIIAIEAQESYCSLHTTDKNYTVSKNLKHFETLLESLPQFMRVHKSWLVNKEHLLNYSKSELTMQLSGGIIAKLSKYKKAEFETAISL
jgi:two-component system LytT family response regulator